MGHCSGDVIGLVLKFLFPSGKGPLTFRPPHCGFCGGGRAVVTPLRQTQI